MERFSIPPKKVSIWGWSLDNVLYID